ncbi:MULTISPECIES: transporter substrate-binding domain-containing protein [Streptomyces]|uniref:transporter substrate-binding domain-containing protein n=1 Tax=Streptomyces TaxID=1883 RepID=UPI0009A23194|nr:MULTISPECIES: transporter substrate-binding domain-containing protein [unclassified Streptomyces]QNQ38692.1 transporter substrate-binding domain-containing protein [Streptomyces sp. CB00271]
MFSGERETALKGNDADLVIASCSATPKREKEVDFSVPYCKTGQSLLMRKSHTKDGGVQTWDENAVSRDATFVDMKINRIEDLQDGTDSCTVDSTYSEFMEGNLEYKEKFDVQKKEASHKDCIEGLLDEGAVGSYEMISTDDVILAGLDTSTARRSWSDRFAPSTASQQPSGWLTARTPAVPGGECAGGRGWAVTSAGGLGASVRAPRPHTDSRAAHPDERAQGHDRAAASPVLPCLRASRA